MKKLFALLPAAALLAGAAPSGRDAFLARETVEVRTVKGPLPADPADALWAGLPATIVQAAPQRSVRLHDRRANEALARRDRRIEVFQRILAAPPAATAHGSSCRESPRWS